MYLLDTNAVPELRKPRPRGGVLARVRSLEEAVLRVAVLTLGEIRAGIELTREQEPARATDIEGWLNRVAGAHSVLPPDASVFHMWARLMHRRSDILYDDAMITAVARTCKLS